jgi:hypothetical protein
VDYIGLLGKDPKSDPETAAQWRELRDMVVHGPRLEFITRDHMNIRSWQRRVVRGVFRSTMPSFDNLPKGIGKTEVMRSMFETGEATGMHGYMNYPGLFADLEMQDRKDSLKAHQRQGLAAAQERFYAALPTVTGRIPILTGLDGIDGLLGGGLRKGDWYAQPMHVSPEIRAKACRNWPIQAMGSDALMEAYTKAMEGRVFIDLESDWDIEGMFDRLKRHVDGFVVDSIPKKRGGSPHGFAFDYKMGHYIYNPTDRLTQLYEKARKKYKHKDAVNYLIKREKHGRKWVAKQLEEIGAAYANKERDELRAKVKKAADEKWEKQYADLYDIPTFSPGDYKQFAGRIDRTPKESEE